MRDGIGTAVKGILVLQRPCTADRIGGGVGLAAQKWERTRIEADQPIGGFALDQPQRLDARFYRPRGRRRIVPARRGRECPGRRRAEDRKGNNENSRRPARSKDVRHAKIVCVKFAEFTPGFLKIQAGNREPQL
jgi:hypothetical protein